MSIRGKITVKKETYALRQSYKKSNALGTTLKKYINTTFSLFSFNMFVLNMICPASRYREYGISRQLPLKLHHGVTGIHTE